MSGNEKKLALQARAVAIAARCRNATAEDDAGEEWRAFVRGDPRFEAIVAEEGARLGAIKLGTRQARLREWCADGPAFIRKLYGTSKLYAPPATA